MLVICFIFSKVNKERYENVSLVIVGQFLPLLIFYYLSYSFFLLPEPQHFFINYHFAKVLIILVSLNWFINFLKEKKYNKIKKVFNIFLVLVSIVFFTNLSKHQMDITKLESDMRPKETKMIIEWIKKNTQSESTLLTIDSFLLHTIPTLSGRYNFIPSLKSLNPTSIHEPIDALRNAKIILGLNKEFNGFINSSCQNRLNIKLYRFNKLCEYIFHGFYKIDKGSYHYKKFQTQIPKEINIPDKNKVGNHVVYNYANLRDVNVDSFKVENLPKYIIWGPAENYFSTKDNFLDYYKPVYTTKNYHILELKNS